MKRLLLLTIMTFFAYSISAQEIIFQDNFDSYEINKGLAEQSDDWTTWTNKPGTSEDGTISNEQSSSPDKSLKITGDNDNIYKLGKKTTGKYAISFKIYIPANNGGYYNVQHVFGATWAFEVWFPKGGKGHLLIDKDKKPFNFDHDKWITADMTIDVTGDATLKLDGTVIHTWPYKQTASSPDIATPTLDVLNFYAGAEANANYTPLYFIDDFKYENLGGGLIPPTIDADLSNIEASGSDPLILTLSNKGEESLNFNIYPVYPVAGKNLAIAPSPIEKTVVLGTQNTVIETTTLFNGESQEIDFTRDATLTHLKGVSDKAIGFSNPTEARISSRFRPEDVKDYIGMKIKEVLFFIGDGLENNKAKAYIWERGDVLTPGPGATLYEKDFTVNPSINEVAESILPIDKDIYIDGKDIWVGYGGKDKGDEFFPFLMDRGPRVPLTGYISHGPGWVESGVAEAGNWGIVAILTGEAQPNWLKLSPEKGTIQPNGTSQIKVDFKTNNLSSGTYTSEINIASNDPENQYKVIPVTLTITSIDEIENLGVMTFPNPAQDYLNVKTNATMSQVTLINQLGQVVYQQQPKGTSLQINTSGMERGVYFVQVEVKGHKIVTNKIVIK